MATMGKVRRPTGAAERPSKICHAWRLRGVPCLSLAMGETVWCARHQELREEQDMAPPKAVHADPYMSGELA